MSKLQLSKFQTRENFGYLNFEFVCNLVLGYCHDDYN